MKSLPGVLTQFRRAIALFCILTAAFAQFPSYCDAAAPPSQAVTIENDRILIHSGTKLSKPDQKALNQILAKYDKSLYKIETYKNGHVIRTQGQLSDMLIDKTIASEAADAKASGNSNRTLQIIAATTSQRLLGATTNPQSSPGTTTNPQSSPGTTTNPQSSPGATTNPQSSPGTTTNPQSSPGTTTNPQHHSPSPVGEKASRELIERLKPILEKYSKK